MSVSGSGSGSLSYSPESTVCEAALVLSELVDGLTVLQDVIAEHRVNTAAMRIYLLTLLFICAPFGGFTGKFVFYLYKYLFKAVSVLLQHPDSPYYQPNQSN